LRRHTFGGVFRSFLFDVIPQFLVQFLVRLLSTATAEEWCTANVPVASPLLLALASLKLL